MDLNNSNFNSSLPSNTTPGSLPDLNQRNFEQVFQKIEQLNKRLEEMDHKLEDISHILREIKQGSSYH